MSTLPALSPSIALWRIEKLTVAEIKQRLQAAGLTTQGTKRTLAQRLQEHLQQSEGNDPQESESGGSERSATPSETDESQRRVRRRGRSRSPLSAGELRALKDMLRRRARTRSPTASSSRSSRSSSLTSAVSSSSITDRSTRSPPRSRSSRKRRRRRCSNPPRTRRRRHRRSRSKSPRRRGRGRHTQGSSTLPPIPDRLKGRIKRGEYIDLSLLLQVNLTKAGERNGRRSDSTARPTTAHHASITDFDSWMEAWSLYAAVLSSLHPHLAPRLFHYQHFLTLKSRTFQTKAWLRYDAEFRLKLAANSSWHFETVDTELWASCFAADGLATASSTSQACFSCGSTSHFYAACPQRRLSTTRAATGPKQDNTRPLGTSREQPSSAPSGDQQEPCYIFNDKGRCFRGQRCPYSHLCTHCGGQHAKRGCPNLRT